MTMTAAEKISKWIKGQSFQVSVFITTFIIGLLVHAFMFTNKFYNYFEMNNILTPMSMDKGDTLAMGRWFLPVVSRLSSVYSMPMVNGMICLFCLSLITCMVVDLLRIRRMIPAALAGGILVTFPGVASYLSYGVNSDVFCVALLLSVASAWVLYRLGGGIKGMIASAVILCFSIGVYQPFMSVTIALIFAMIFLEVWENGRGFAAILKRVLYYVVTLAAGFALYYLVLKIVTAMLGITVGNYHGVNEMASFTLKGIAKGFVYTYLYFLRYLFTKEYTNFNLLTVFDVISAVLFLYYTITGYRRFCSGKRQKGSLLCQILLILLLPLGMNATPFLMGDRVGNGVDRYMMFSMMLLFVLLLKLMDSAADKDGAIREKEADQGKTADVRGRINLYGQWAVLICAAVLIFSDAYMCNQGYFRAHAMTESENAMLNRLAYRLEDNPDWSPDTPVYFANCEALFNENTDTDIDAFTGLTRVDGTEIKPWYNYDAVVKYMRVYLNFRITKPSAKVQEAILQTEEFKQMGLYPQADSIRMIDGVLVVKFNENEEEPQED